MKTVSMFLALTLITSSYVCKVSAHNNNSVCTNFNTATRIAREAVKHLISLSDAQAVVAYYGGASSSNGLTRVDVQPYFQYSKDWYKVLIRDSDCRITNISLFAEGLSNDCFDSFICARELTKRYEKGFSRLEK